MLFRQWAKVIDGTKTETRRLKHDGQQAVLQHGLDGAVQIVAVLDMSRVIRLTVYRVGQLHPVIPARGKHAVWYTQGTDPLSPPEQQRPTYLIEGGHSPSAVANLKATLREHGFRQAAICLTTIHEQRLHDITREEALREGVGSVDEYRALWEELHRQSGRRWEDNPPVWALTFRLATEE